MAYPNKLCRKLQAVNQPEISSSDKSPAGIMLIGIQVIVNKGMKTNNIGNLRNYFVRKLIIG